MRPGAGRRWRRPAAPTARPARPGLSPGSGRASSGETRNSLTELAHLSDQLNLDRGVQRQHGDPDRAAGVLTRVAEDLASSSLAPLMTCGWAVKSGALATNPTTLTIRVMADSPPAWPPLRPGR